MKKDIDGMWVELIEAILDENEFYAPFKEWLSEHRVALSDAADQLYRLMLDGPHDVSFYDFLDSFKDAVERAKAEGKEIVGPKALAPLLDLFEYIDRRGLWLNCR